MQVHVEPHSPGAVVTLLLLVQKQVTQENDTPITILRAPCVARHAGRLRTVFRARMGTESRNPLVGNSRDPLRVHAIKQVLAEFPGTVVSGL